MPRPITTRSLRICQASTAGTSSGTTSIAYRPEFLEWGARLRIRFNPNAISAEQIVNLVEIAGFAVGVGDWRPEKAGQHGMFTVDRGAIGGQAA